MTIDQELLDILRCPADLGEVEYREDEQRIVCLKCGNRYKVIDGDIPNMLIDEAEKPKGKK